MADLYTLIFEGFLKLTECTGSGSWGCYNNDFQHDFVFALFIPHVVLAVFFYMAFRGLGNRGLETLLGIAGYVFMIQMNWYPLFSSLSLLWMSAAVLLAFYMFVLAKFIHPAKGGAYGRAGADIAKKIKTLQRRGMSEAEIMDELRRDVLEIDNPAMRMMLMREMKSICPNCGASNPPGSTACHSCKSPLHGR